jgi:ADP-ribose pyrophosphatase YjhB (NUDIX family)
MAQLNLSWNHLESIKISKYWCQQSINIFGDYERRYIDIIRINSTILQKILNSVNFDRNYSFNLMMITKDHKVLLLQRAQSFHFPKVVRDLKLNKINFNLLNSLYTSELEKIRRLFFNFLPTITYTDRCSKFIHIFPGGHSNNMEKVISTLLREFKEETSINIDIKQLSFNQSLIFKVLIFDIMVKKTFKNLVFPVKVAMSSQEIFQSFKQTKHTRNPTFVDITTSDSLYDAFIKVQKLMVL